MSKTVIEGYLNVFLKFVALVQLKPVSDQTL